jgi:hypothetical protein
VPPDAAVDSAVGADTNRGEWHPIPITLNQERRLLLEEAGHAAGVPAAPFHTALAVEIDRPDVPALQRALRLVTGHQGALRASFVGAGTLRRWEPIGRLMKDGVVEPGVYKQRLHATSNLTLEIKRLQPGDPDSVTLESAREALLRRFDSTRPPLARALLIEKPGRPALLLVVLHHLISDRESLGLLHRNLEAAYASVLRGGDRRWSPQPLPYDGALAQLKALYENDAKGAADYWQRQWGRYESSQFALTDFPLAPATGATTGLAPEPVILDRSGLTRVRAAARASRVTPTAIYLAAFAIALAKCTGRNSSAIWSHVDNRWRTTTDGVVAWLVHSHLLGISIDPSASGGHFLAEVRQVMFRAIEYGYLPLAELWQRIGRSLEGDFRVQFHLTAEEPGAGRPGQTLRRVGVPGRDSRPRGLELFVTERPDHVSFKARFADQRLASGVRQMLTSYITVLDRLITDPSAAISTM